jgi:predicted Fe-Mo cluster-binding NifX family protein
MWKKVLIPLYGNNVAPRFDLATEVLMASIDDETGRMEHRTVVLPHPSPEDLCHLVLTERVEVVICGGIEEEYYQYLRWKKVRVIDGIIGRHESVLQRFNQGELEPGDIIAKGIEEDLGSGP